MRLELSLQIFASYFCLIKISNHVLGPEGQYQAELRKVNLPIVSREDCQMRLRSTKLGQYFQLHGSFICAGGEANRDTCRGDGGGPLVCQSSTGRFVQVCESDYNKNNIIYILEFSSE